MIRGIERRDIVLDDRDLLDFVERLSQLLLKTRSDYLAWCLLSNHAHILLRPTRGVLSEMMQRLLTGYAVVFNHGTNDHEAYDERVLGSGEFVEHIWHEANLFNAVAAPPPSLDEIIERVAALYGIETTTLPHGSKQKTISDVRAALCYVAIRMFGYRGIDLSKRLGLSEAGVVFAARRGEKLNVISKLMEIWSDTAADAARYNSDDNIHEILE